MKKKKRQKDEKKIQEFILIIKFKNIFNSDIHLNLKYNYSR